VTWVAKAKLRELKGWTNGQIKARVQRYWRRGVEYADVDGSRMFNLEAIDARADRVAASQSTPKSKRRAERSLLRLH
jgi:hypothetical protein